MGCNTICIDTLSAAEPKQFWAPSWPRADLDLEIEKAFREEKLAPKIREKLKFLNPGQMVTVIYFGEYEEALCKVSGVVTKVDCYWKVLEIGCVDVCFNELCDIILEPR